MSVFILVIITLCPLLYCYHLEKDERVRCFTFNVFIMSCYFYVLWLFLTVPWVALQCVIVVFTDYHFFTTMGPGFFMYTNYLINLKQLYQRLWIIFFCNMH